VAEYRKYSNITGTHARSEYKRYSMTSVVHGRACGRGTGSGRYTSRTLRGGQRSTRRVCSIPEGKAL
jgi:hypothetical protein